MTTQGESDDGEPVARPLRPVIRDGRAVQKSADVDPCGDVVPTSRLPQPVEREMRLGSALARADEDQPAAIHFECCDLVREYAAFVSMVPFSSSGTRRDASPSEPSTD